MTAITAPPALATTDAFPFTGTEQIFTVPAGVSQLSVTLVGGAGGAGGNTLSTPLGGSGGQGALVSARLAVHPFETLYIEIGGNGSKSSNAMAFNGGGAGTTTGGSGGGGGGGATDIRTCSIKIACPTLGSSGDPRLVVAGGGGGGGATALSAAGGAGASAGALPAAGSNGSDSPGGTGGTGGGGGTSTTAGSAGAAGSGNNLAGLSGTAGAAGQGGSGQDPGTTSSPGGGGGGGCYGGGGGGGGGRDSGGQVAGGGGGGTGSSCGSAAASDLSVSTASSANPSVAVTYTPGTPSNVFTFGKLKLNNKRGTGTLPIVLPGPGLVVMSGNGVNSVTKQVSAAGTLTLKITPKGNTKKRLKRKHKAKISLQVAFAPTQGVAKIVTKTITVIRK